MADVARRLSICLPPPATASLLLWLVWCGGPAAALSRLDTTNTSATQLAPEMAALCILIISTESCL